MATSYYPYSIDMLPVAGITDITANVETIRARLMSTRDILTGILAGPFGYPAALKQALDNIRFHVVNGLSLIESFIASGRTGRDAHSDVNGLVAAVDLHITSIRLAKPMWDSWLKDAYASSGSSSIALPRIYAQAAPLVQPVAQPQQTGVLASLSQPTELKDYVAMGVAGAAVLLLLKLWR